MNDNMIKNSKGSIQGKNYVDGQQKDGDAR